MNMTHVFLDNLSKFLFVLLNVNSFVRLLLYGAEYFVVSLWVFSVDGD